MDFRNEEMGHRPGVVYPPLLPLVVYHKGGREREREGGGMARAAIRFVRCIVVWLLTVTALESPTTLHVLCPARKKRNADAQAPDWGGIYAKLMLIVIVSLCLERKPDAVPSSVDRRLYRSV